MSRSLVATLGAVALIASAAVLSACSSDDGKGAAGSGDLSGVTLNVIDAIGQTQLAAAGLDDTPYKLNYVQAPSLVEMANAFSGNKIDIGLNSDIGYSTFASQGLGVTIVHAMQRPAGICGIVVGADTDIRTVADLKGRPVANTVGAGSEIVALKAFSNAGLTFPADVKAVNLDVPTDGAAALLSGKVDAWLGCGIPISTVVSEGKARFIADGSQAANPWTAQNYWGVANDSWADQAKRAAVIDYVNRVDQALVWGNEHVEELSKVQSTKNNSPYEATLAYNKIGPTTGLDIDQSVVKGLQATYDTLAQLERVTPGGDVSKLFDDSANAEIN